MNSPTDSILDATPRISSSAILGRILFSIAILSQIYVAWKYWNPTWDDSAITLGFARTFALTGKIEPTPGSGIVEGYSTTLWMLLMAAVAKFSPEPSSLLSIAKTATLLINIGNLFLIKALFSPWMTSAIAELAAGVVGCSFMFYETINGMETPLLLALILTLLLLQRSSSRLTSSLYDTCGLALILVRWESAWFLIPILLSDPQRKRSIRTGLLWFMMLIATNAARWLYFASFLPNTIIAKRGPPYTSDPIHHHVLQHLSLLRDMARSCWPLLLVVVLYLLFSGPVYRALFLAARSSRPYRQSFLILTFSIILTVAIGRNWGPSLRSFYPGFPFLVAVILFPLSLGKHQVRLQRAKALATLGILAIGLINMDSLIREMNTPNGPKYMPGATIADVRKMDTALKRLQDASGRKQLTYAGPDMGAILLYSNGVRVIDLGLLCNRHLARARYNDIEDFLLVAEEPDVIEIHGVWTVLSGIARLPRFYEDYRPLMVSGNRLFVRKELLSTIAPEALASKTHVGLAQSAYGTPKYGAVSTQDEYIDATFKRYLILQ